MTSPTHQRRPANRAGLLLLFAVLGGVFGMHALDSHGAVATRHAGMAHHGSASLSMVMSAGPTVSDSSLRAPADDPSSAMSLCVGVLVASVLLLLLRRARGLRVVGLAPRWLGTARPSGVHGRDRDPPSLALLSVRRC